ncbi:MAG TPA: sodium:solute symporter [Thermoanaerobaculia bacterium]|nr:sodium:solute symporter [Thermoanaerobaculia bacterium]
MTLDTAIIVLYLAAVIGAGVYFSRRQKTTRQYFLASHDVPWWAIAASIVATETSTITFISVPGIAWARGGDFRFLQLVLGYCIARVIISAVFMPWYFRGELVTVYELLQTRFGAPVKALAASLFVVMRTVADGVRLLLTAFVIAAVFKAAGISGSIIGLGVVMIVFTLIGGIEAIVWIEVVQLGIYIFGAIAAAVVLAQHVGLAHAIELGAAAGKFRFFDFSLDLTKTFSFWSGVIGGTFLTLSTHGTDQYLVQRYLCTDRPRSAAKALLVSGVVVFVQFAMFLFIGVLLFAFYGEHAPVSAPDQVFPHFIANHMPPGLSGLVVAAILAAAMSSSLNSIAATVVADLMRPRDDRRAMQASRVITVLAGIAQIAVGLALQHTARSALNTALAIASLINGPILGVFFLGATKRASTPSALVGMSAGIAAVSYVAFATKTAWPWYAVVGSVVTFGVGMIASMRATRRASLLGLLLLAGCSRAYLGGQVLDAVTGAPVPFAKVRVYCEEFCFSLEPESMTCNGHWIDVPADQKGRYRADLSCYRATPVAEKEGYVYERQERITDRLYLVPAGLVGMRTLKRIRADLEPELHSEVLPNDKGITSEGMHLSFAYDAFLKSKAIAETAEEIAFVRAEYCPILIGKPGFESEVAPYCKSN